MITNLLFRVILKYLKHNLAKLKGTMHIIKSTLKVMLFLLFALLMKMSFAQQSVFEYEITRNNKVIGNTVLTGIRENGKVIYRISTEIRLNIIKEFIAKSVEETVFEKGVMTSSSIHRTVNGNLKTKRKMRLLDSVYHIEEEGKSKRIHTLKVMYTTNGLCLNEPVNQNQVYSENLQQWVKISQVNPHSYKLTLPDGNYTIYHYQNGTCVKMDVSQTFYNLTITLKNQGKERNNIPILSSN